MRYLPRDGYYGNRTLGLTPVGTICRSNLSLCHYPIRKCDANEDNLVLLYIRLYAGSHSNFIFKFPVFSPVQLQILIVIISMICDCFICKTDLTYFQLENLMAKNATSLNFRIREFCVLDKLKNFLCFF